MNPSRLRPECKGFVKTAQFELDADLGNPNRGVELFQQHMRPDPAGGTRPMADHWYIGLDDNNMRHSRNEYQRA